MENKLKSLNNNKMLVSTLFIVATQLINVCYGTRLPLEDYELTPRTTNNNPAGVTLTDLKHKNLEYSTFNAPDSGEGINLEIFSSSKEQEQSHLTNQLDRRRSRKILDILKPHHDLAENKLHDTNGGGVGGGVGTGTGIPSSRILYQVGSSESDLPICAPNAVCSKIDLYETPWIERQCRCPAINKSPEIVIHHHHKDSHMHTNHNTEKYHSYYEQRKILRQSQHLLMEAADYATDKKYTHLQLKKLMHKLGAVYEDDIDFDADYASHDENSALAGNKDTSSLLYDDDDISSNEFPHVAMKRQQQQQQHQHLYTNSAHMRHSGHMGHQEKLTFIGGCPSNLGVEDGHTIADKTKHYKLCEPVHRLPVCRYYRDYTWTLTITAEMNSTEQIVHCRCPKNSVTYLTKPEPLVDGDSRYKFLFACSPLTRLRCQRKEPCKLFTVRKRQESIEEANFYALCQCPKGHHCPSHHTQSGVIADETYLEDNRHTYFSGYCMAND